MKVISFCIAGLLFFLLLFCYPESTWATQPEHSFIRQGASTRPTPVQHLPASVLPNPLPVAQGTVQPLRGDVGPLPRNATALTQCTEAITNGGFENDSAWQTNIPASAYYDTTYSYRGSRSVALDSYSDVNAFLWQSLTVPADAESIDFSFRSIVPTDPVDTNVYVQMYSADFSTLLQEYYLIYDCNCEWFSFTPTWDLAQLRGQKVNLTFALYLNGTIDEVNVDEVSLQICRADITPTPTPTPTTVPPTATATNTALPTPTPTVAPPTATVTPTPSPTPTPPPTPLPAQPDAFEAEHSCANAKTIATDGVGQTHTFHAPLDSDWVRFDATAGVNYRIEVQIPNGSPADVILEVYPDCENLPTSLWSAPYTPGARLDFVAPATGPVLLKLKNNPDTLAGDQVAYQLSVRPPALPQQERGALIIVAGRLKPNDPLQRNIHNVSDAVYALFTANGYTNDNIYYLATDAERKGYDASATVANLRQAITTWAADKVGGTRALTLYMMDHGDKGRFYIDKPNGEELRPKDLDSWLTELEVKAPGLKINVIIEACNSGSFTADFERISKVNRVIITSTSANNLAYASEQGAYFSDHLITALQQGQTLSQSFFEAQVAVRQIVSLQEPWLDGDGDGTPNEAEDNAVAAGRGFGVGAFGDDQWPPYIKSATPPGAIVNRRGVISAEVRDDQAVRRVWAVIYPPSYQPPQNSGELTPETLPTLILQPQGENRYAAEYAGFDEAGLYRIVIHAEDNNTTGLTARPLAITAETNRQLFLPIIKR